MTERPNKELALRYWSDPTLKAWYWSRANAGWVQASTPWFADEIVWHVGHEAPTEPPARMCELAGITFPMPITEAPEVGARCWIANLLSPENPNYSTWNKSTLDFMYLESSLHQATEDGAIQQGRAMAAALLQAIEGAK